ADWGYWHQTKTVLAWAEITTAVAAGDPQLAGQPLSAEEGDLLVNVPVATFTVDDLGATPGDFAAFINWGDGSAPTAGTVSGGAGGFGISGSHRYTQVGNYGVYVRLVRLADQADFVVGTTATITDAPLSNQDLILRVPSSFSFSTLASVASWGLG